jgi:peptide chain release factor subunit 1
VISLAETGKLGAVRSGRTDVVSLYLTIPRNPADLRGLAAGADDLLAAAGSAAGGDGHAAEEDRRAVREKLQLSGRDWLGRTVAVFACAGAGLFEAFPLPGQVPDRAVLGIRPHIRPLLTVVQWYPAYQAVVADRRHAWLFRVAGEETQTVTTPAAPGIRAAGFGGWYGLETYRVQQRTAQLARHHYRDTAAMVEKAMAYGEQEPLVIGGHDEGIRQLLAILPPAVLERFAGSFVADVHILTPARVRELAEPLVSRWARQRAERLAGQVLTMPPGSLAATGLAACLAAVNAHATEILTVPGAGLVPGGECGRCGVLSTIRGRCPDCGTAALPIPDLIDEMVIRTLQDGGQVYPVGDGLSQLAAGLRFPLAR